MCKLTNFNLYIRQALLYPLAAPFLPPEDKVASGHPYAAGRLTGAMLAEVVPGLPKTGQVLSLRPGDDGDLQIGAPEDPPRYTVNGDGTVTDHGTGLTWVRQPETLGGVWEDWGEPKAMVWADAIDNCNALDYAGRHDWRLPNRHEMITLGNWELYNPGDMPEIFPNTKSQHYWTSTGRGDHLTYKVTVGGIACGQGTSSETSHLYVRPVRGPEPAEIPDDPPPPEPTLLSDIIQLAGEVATPPGADPDLIAAIQDIIDTALLAVQAKIDNAKALLQLAAQGDVAAAKLIMDEAITHIKDIVKTMLDDIKALSS